MLEFLLALVPSAGVLLLFWLVVKGLVEADRRERLAQARSDSQRAAGAGTAEHPSSSPEAPGVSPGT